MTLYAKVDTGKEAPSWDSYTPSLRESVQASWEAALASNPTTSLLRLHEVMLAERGLNKDAVLDLIDEAENGGLASFADLNALPEPRKLSLEEQTRRIREAGLNGVLEAREGYTSEVLDILIPQKQAELSHRFVASRAPASHMPFSLVAGFGASALDPINLASAFVPAVGEARALSLLRQSAGSAGRAATRAKIGLAGGVAGAVLTEPFVYAGQKAIQADYGMADSLLNIGFGAVMGAGMQPLAGGVGDFFRTRRGIRQPWEIAEKTDVSEALRLDLAGRMEKAFLAANPEADAEQVQRNALASAALFDARARAREYDTGLKVEDFYRKYGPQFRSWREDVASSADRFLIPEMWDRPGGSQSLGRASSTDASLSRRFADMPTLEADSLQWFGEGGEIGADEQDLRKAIKEWAKKRFSQGEIVSNADTGWQIQITPKGIKNTLAHGFDELLARSAPFIPKLVETGIHLDSVEKKAGLTSHIFANKIRLDGKDYVVGFVLREDGNGNRFYDHELTEIIDPNSLNRAEFPDGMGGHRTRANRGDVMNILREKLGVNDGSGSILFSGKKPNSAQVGFNPSEMGEHSGNIQNLGRESGTSGPDWLYRENNEKTLQNTGPANRGREVNILREKLGVNDGSGSILFSGKKPNGAQIGFNPSGMGEHSGNIQNLGRASSTDASLSRRFADMPTLEADSLQWFGEGRAISYSSEADSATMRKELRNSAKEWAKKRFSQGETIFNADTGWQIQITPKGIGDTLAHGFDELLARSAPFIPKLVETGIHLDSVEKKAGLTSHIFANKIRLDGKDYVVGFVLREDGNGNRFYDHELTEIIDPNSLNRAEFPDGMGGHRTRANRGDVMNILREKLGVNDGSGSILFSGKGPRAQVNFDANGKAVITFFASADFSSAPHELYHVFRRDLADAAREPAASPRVREQWAKIEAFVGAKPGEAWTREMEEQFARAGERFLLEGKAPSPFLAEVFTQLTHWLLEIYADADAAGLEISPAMREVFNSMFSVPADQADALFRSAVGELGVRQWEQDFLEGEGGGKLLGRYLSGFLTELTAQGQDRYALFRNGALDNEIVEALHMLDSSGKSAFQGPQEALEIAGIMRKWQEQVRADQKEAGTSDQETATVMRSDYKREQAVGALREAFTHDLESAVQRIASMRQPEAQLFTFPTNYRNINVKPEKVLTRLGSVLCSSFQEFPSFISEVSYQGQSFLASLQHDMKNLLKDRNSAEQQKIMNLCGVFFKNMINGLGSHLARQAVPGKIACTQHLFFRMNAFDWWSSVWKASVAALLQNDYAFKKERDGDEFTSGQHQETVSDTLLSEVLRLVSRFKSFPSAFALQGRAGEYWGRGMRAWGRVVQNQHGEINNFARLFLMFVLFGYGAMTAGRLGAGKTPHDPGEPKTWLAAAARSGALGLYADFLLGEKARLRSRQRMPGEGTTTEPGARPGNLWFSDNGEKRKTYNM